MHAAAKTRVQSHSRHRTPMYCTKCATQSRALYADSQVRAALAVSCLQRAAGWPAALPAARCAQALVQKHAFRQSAHCPVPAPRNLVQLPVSTREATRCLLCCSRRAMYPWQVASAGKRYKHPRRHHGWVLAAVEGLRRQPRQPLCPELPAGHALCLGSPTRLLLATSGAFTP